MDIFDRDQLDQLLASEGGPHITIFLSAPSEPMNAKDDAIRIANLARKASGVLRENWMPAHEENDFIKPLRDLAEDGAFLANRRHGVAIFLSENCFKVFRLDDFVGETVVVDRIFHIRPVLAALDHLLSFSVLRLSKQQVSLLTASPNTISEVELPGLPEGFEKSMAGVSGDRGSQLHSATHTNAAAGKQAAVFHGQGGLPDAEKAELTDYLRHVDRSVCAQLNRRQDWLVLAGVDCVTAIYRNISAYPSIAPGSASGNLDHLSWEQLVERSKPIAAAAIAEDLKTEARGIRDRRHQKVTTNPEQVLKAAYGGRVKTLFISEQAHLWGSFHPDTAILKQLHHAPTGEPGDPSHDLIEMAAVQTLRHRGRVHSVSDSEMPVDARMVAALRY